jgi:hypothetical protein
MKKFTLLVGTIYATGMIGVSQLLKVLALSRAGLLLR